MATRREEQPAVMTEFTSAQGIRAGIGSGLVLGIVIGGTLWTHDPTNPWVALVLMAFCIIAGAIIGKVVASIQPE